MTTNMKLNLQKWNIGPLDSLHQWMEQQLATLGQTRQIDVANVQLIRLRDASPAYQVNVHLVTPGPDVFAETRDHTLQAAFAKAIAQLGQTIKSRTSKRLNRFKNELKARRAG